MEQVRQFTQAYYQAPWRKQLQVIGTFLLVLVSVALVAGIYLNVSARTATFGRQIQDMQVRMEGSQSLTVDAGTGETVVPIEELTIQISALEAELASLNSMAVTRDKAKEMGFEPYDAESALYLKVPGYTGRQTASLAPPPVPVAARTSTLPEIYKQSLLDWLKNEILQASEVIKKGVLP